MKTIYPEGAESKKAHKLKRRVYVSQGPNFIWHIDGYDKLKAFGFPIHGAIDGSRRKILWPNICPSNNNLYIISYFYVNCISNLKCVPRTIKCDRGNEKVVAGMQRSFRAEHQNSMSGHSRFLLGSSTNNPRIESWWSILKRQSNAWWIKDLKEDLQDEGLFDSSLNHHKECMKFCFSGILQSELDNINEM